MNSRVEGFEVDAYWPGSRLVIELDGLEHHCTRAAIDRDSRRDAALTAAGLRVLRLTWSQVAYDRATLGPQLLAAVSGCAE